MRTTRLMPWFYIWLTVGAIAVAGAADRQAIEDDWARQDGLYVKNLLQIEAIRKPMDALGDRGRNLRVRYLALVNAKTSPSDLRWLALYREACQQRRAMRLGPTLHQLKRIVFTKHYDMGGSHYAYTEGQSDAQHERHFKPGAALCLLEMDGLFGQVRTLIDDPRGVVRDPDVSYDGQRILFAWKKSDRRDDYHLYEMTVADRTIRQLTFGLGAADYEGCYLPNGQIVFNSTRPVQTVDCWWTEVSNLYTCDQDGRYLRRLSYDQVHTNYPTITPDGRVIYTRWDYSDRGQIYPQGLFQMNADGTAQQALYGNNSWFPTAILHARAVAGTQKIVAVFSGHHTHQQGQLGFLDPARGDEENQGAQLIAPVRDTPAIRVDAYGQSGPQFQYPYPLSESAFLVAMDATGSHSRTDSRPYAIYWIDIDGQRELLATDPNISCNQPIPLRARPLPPIQSSRVDYRRNTGTYYVQDVYAGPGLADVKRGTIKKIRVVAITYRAAGIRQNGSRGPAGGALSSTPVSIGNGCWDPKVILGDATVHKDGSACFTAPAHTPLYFQALDHNNRAVQSMRSWSTLQPGERFSCIGCHESKHDAPSLTAATWAMKVGPETLHPFHDVRGGFSFPKHVQPILNRHCIICHDDRTQRINGKDLANRRLPDEGKAFSLLDRPVRDERAGRVWSDAYLALTESAIGSDKAWTGNPNGRWVKWISVQSEPTLLKPYHAGAARSDLIQLLESGHGSVKLARPEMDKIIAWIDLLVPYCGDYTEANCWTEQEKKKYAHFLAKRKRLQQIEQQNIQALLHSLNQSNMEH